jgi:hypothetical protein
VRYIIYTKDGVSPLHRDRDAAVKWLTDNGWVVRKKQPDEFVKLLDTGNEFASLRRSDHLEVQVNSNSAMSLKAIRGE